MYSEGTVFLNGNEMNSSVIGASLPVTGKLSSNNKGKSTLKTEQENISANFNALRTVVDLWYLYQEMCGVAEAFRNSNCFHLNNQNHAGNHY